MAILTGAIQMEGRVGGLIFYRRGNKTCCRSMPNYRPDSQSAASRQSAGEFGKASKAAKLIRHAMNGLWPLPHDGTLVNRLNKTLYTALLKDAVHPRGQRTLAPAALQQTLTGFRFNKKASLPFQVNITRPSAARVHVSLPDKWKELLKQPRFATHIQVQVAALSVDLEANICHKTAIAVACTPLRDGVVPVLELPHKKNVTTIMVLQIRYLNEGGNGQVYTSADLSCMQSGVIGVLLPEKQPQKVLTSSPHVPQPFTQPHNTPSPNGKRKQLVTTLPAHPS